MPANSPFQSVFTTKLPNAQRYERHEYVEAGCFQVLGTYATLGDALWLYTKGIMCPGCPADGECEAQKILRRRNASASKFVEPVVSETVRQEATRRGISISEVRRQRNAGAAS